jgi:regulator of protease activity HflC (stomatin/prohibitin superfamily)
MAEIRPVLLWRHFRGEPTCQTIHTKKGQRKRSARGLSFTFAPWSSAIAEVPMDDRDVVFLFHARSADFQAITVQGTFTYRILDPDLAATRIDFQLDLVSGQYQQTPLEQLAAMLSQLGRQYLIDYLAQMTLAEVLASGVEPLRQQITTGLAQEATLADVGLGIVAVRVADVAPSAELEKALQMPTREGIQERADQATFARRATAVEHERAIAENELANRIELSKRQAALVDQDGENERKRAEAAASAREITTTSEARQNEIQAQAAAAEVRLRAAAEAERVRVVSAAEAEQIAALEGAKAAAEAERMAIYTSLDSDQLLALAAHTAAGKLDHIDQLAIGADGLSSAFTRLLGAQARDLESER